VFSGRARLPSLDDTIVALSSAAGPGARAVVRVSGKQAFPIARTLLPDLPQTITARHWQAGAIHLEQVHSPLPVDVFCWPAPKTYTGQDLVELHTISSMPLVDLLITRCLHAGGRAAQPGEFTMRAFLAGKLDLTRAEAVLGVIEARDRQELDEALAQLSGGVAQPLQVLREDLLNLLADVEAGLDFADEDIQTVDRTALLHRVTKGLALITLVRKQMQQRTLAQRPFRVVLAGRPNAGKSTLFNALVGRDAALVSPTPGTTRDWLEANVTMDGVTLTLIDTAGWRETAEALEGAAQSLGRDEIARADLVLWCRAPHEQDAAEDPFSARCFPRALNGPSDGATPRLLEIATKSDLGDPAGNLLAVSAITGAGIAQLRRQLAAAAKEHGGSPLAASLSRCRHHVETCLAHLRAAHHLALEEQPAELLALELRLALEDLGAMVGAVYTDDLLDRIFSRFCIGN
jgi:tRNA modification GTPase